MLDIEFYRLSDGTAPVEEFLDSLNIKMRQKDSENTSQPIEIGKEI